MAFERLGEKIPLFLRTDRILFRGTVDDDAKKIRSERLIQKPVTTAAALGQGNARPTLSTYSYALHMRHGAQAAPRPFNDE